MEDKISLTLRKMVNFTHVIETNVVPPILLQFYLFSLFLNFDKVIWKHSSFSIQCTFHPTWKRRFKSSLDPKYLLLQEIIILYNGQWSPREIFIKKYDEGVTNRFTKKSFWILVLPISIDSYNMTRRSRIRILSWA